MRDRHHFYVTTKIYLFYYFDTPPECKPLTIFISGVYVLRLYIDRVDMI
ncbi:hypothetical protein VS_II0793 [Vibrio atlanticus]|uniref:Uncharacterized protein n=1 Tax=Vibrio atlanticus (strain LGP32) TaxID=575788 RepID=B7VSH6_VIBA3|nr:hypothetical protein VS_II0793 [Vibrio atlanticus]